jgi:hypothetical protein
MPMMDASSSRRTSRRYWLIVLVMIALGILTIFSFGLYFWFIAAGLIVMSPFRARPRVFRSGIALFLGFLIAYVLLAPWGCSQTFISDLTTGEEMLSPIVCTSPVGVEYSGPEPFEPSRTPALVAGGVSAAVASASTWLLTGITGRGTEPT